MTSLEALESWFNVISTNDKIRWEEHYKAIKKDLELLDILKNNEISISYIEQSTSYDDYISKCDCFRSLSYIAEEEYTKLKEWLENDK